MFLLKLKVGTLYLRESSTFGGFVQHGYEGMAAIWYVDILA